MCFFFLVLLFFFFFLFFFVLFFFFQAEDGIRDWSVTGVQTCALPICDALPPYGVAHSDQSTMTQGYIHVHASYKVVTIRCLRI